MGHVLSQNGVIIDENKVKAILEIKPPKNVSELKTFMGMVNYTAKFLPKLSETTKFLRQLEKKAISWHWEDN